MKKSRPIGKMLRGENRERTTNYNYSAVVHSICSITTSIVFKDVTCRVSNAMYGDSG